jgi:hypothetical protein
MQDCAVCRRQMISCDCRYDEDPPDLFDDEDDEWDDPVVSLLPRLASRRADDTSA